MNPLTPSTIHLSVKPRGGWAATKRAVTEALKHKYTILFPSEPANVTPPLIPSNLLKNVVP